MELISEDLIKRSPYNAICLYNAIYRYLRVTINTELISKGLI